MTVIRFTIKGEPASKANSRKLVTLRRFSKKKQEMVDMPGSIKSDKARSYERFATLQIPPAAKQMLTGPVKVTLRIFYASARPDLDESVVLDVLQAKYAPEVDGRPRELIRKGVYINDRQIFEKHVYKTVGDPHPRAEIEVEPLQPQAMALELGIDIDVPKERPMTIVPIDGKPPF